MTPKEKALELVDKFLDVEDDYLGDNGCGITPYEAKQCALIAIDLILSEFYADDFYLEVKQEIEKL